MNPVDDVAQAIHRSDAERGEDDTPWTSLEPWEQDEYRERAGAALTATAACLDAAKPEYPSGPGVKIGDIADVMTFNSVVARVTEAIRSAVATSRTAGDVEHHRQDATSS